MLIIIKHYILVCCCYEWMTEWMLVVIIWYLYIYLNIYIQFLTIIIIIYIFKLSVYLSIYPSVSFHLGAFLTRVMCEAMNRSLGNVILGILCDTWWWCLWWCTYADNDDTYVDDDWWWWWCVSMVVWFDVVQHHSLLTLIYIIYSSLSLASSPLICICIHIWSTIPTVGGYGTTVTAPSSASQEILVHTEIDASGAAEALRNADKIVIVPGYGLAVAQAATVVADIALSLRKEGKEVCGGYDDYDDDRTMIMMVIVVIMAMIFIMFIMTLMIMIWGDHHQ